MAEAKARKKPASPPTRQARRKKRRRRAALSWARALILALLLGLFLRGFVFSEPQNGDIVLCAFPGREGRFVKRVVGTPGDTVSISQGTTTRNGEPVAEPYVTLPAGEDFGPVTLEENQYLVMGDNRLKSRDSRDPEVGALEEGAFSGRVRFRLWPFEVF